MDVSVVLTLVQTILQLLESPISREIESLWGFKSQLHKLQNTMSVIQAVLTNVARLESQQLPITIPPVTLQRLQDAVYDADDLFDEVATAARLKNKKLMPGNKLSKEVRLFFSRFNQLTHTFTMSREIRTIRGILDDIAKDHHDFGKMIGPPNDVGVRNIDSSRETGSFVPEEEIIGRDEDRKIVKDFLLDTSLDETISFVSIVGMGGLGKTALAQFVYNDHRIQTEFSPNQMWVCVSNNNDFDVKSLLGQILDAATTPTTSSGLSKDQLQTKLRQQLDGKKYLLVLDDVWNEDDLKGWDELRSILFQGGKGSRIIVTTRSERVAEVARSHHTHVLKGLSDDDSWKLFQKMTRKQQDQMEPRLVEIGKEIVHKCFNVPLAIRFVGSLLQDQDERKWEMLNNTDLADMKYDEKNGIIPVLKISYNYLPPHLKSCFSYCAVFPKDYEFKKEELVYLWMAQGFVRELNGLDLEYLAEDCFMKLLQRCFFQDVYQNRTTGNVFSCKMHDLVHDLAIEVFSGIKNESDVHKISFLQDGKTRHIFIDEKETLVGMEDVEWYPSKMKKFRTCIVRQPHLSKFYHAQLSFKMRNLRVLQLSQTYSEEHRNDIKKLPSMIGELIHLRYLDLSHNTELCMLPNSITQLYNLQTLKLSGCRDLKELPRELSKLVNLRHLDIDHCFELTHMPVRMNMMTCLHKLTNFILGGVRKKAGDVGKLEDLTDLNNLRDDIRIEMRNGWTYDDAEKVKEGGYLINKSLLNTIHIWWNNREESCNDGEHAEALLQGLQPHPNINQLWLLNYPGVGFPRWGMNFAESLPNLVDIDLYGCKRLESLPLLSQLRHLKVLRLLGLTKLEYVENIGRSGDNELVFFPSLTRLVLSGLPELKGWWKTLTSSSTSTSSSGAGGEIGRGDVNHSNNNQNELQLSISDCDKLTTIPGFPNLKTLYLTRSNTILEHLHCLPRESFHHLSSMLIANDDKIESLSTVEVFRSGRLNSLRYLKFEICSKLKSISGRGVWEHFTALQTLELSTFPELELEDNDDELHMPWRWVAPTLRHLTLIGLDKMVKMPKGIQHLTSLRYLVIDSPNLEEIPAWIGCFSSLRQLEFRNCSKVKSLPDEMRHLTSLTYLYLNNCSTELKERCKDPAGFDWHKIKHVPNLKIQ